jgi:hypothetical protein
MWMRYPYRVTRHHIAEERVPLQVVVVVVVVGGGGGGGGGSNITVIFITIVAFM